MDEIAGLISNSGRYSGGSDFEKYLSAFSYSNISSTRKTSESSRLYKPYLNIFGSIQPKILTGLMTTKLMDNGFWDRFLFINSNDATFKLTLDDIDNSISNEYDSYITGLYELIAADEHLKTNGELNVEYYQMSREAKIAWFDFNSQIEDMTMNGTELSSATISAYSKMATYFPRFILMFHILDTVYNHSAGRLKNNSEVNIESVDKAIELVKYFTGQYHLVMDSVAVQKEANSILTESKGMSNKEKVALLKSKDPDMSLMKIANVLGVSKSLVAKYLKP